MAKAGKDAFAAVIYIVFSAYLFYPYFETFETVKYLVPLNCVVGAFGGYVLSKRWVAGFAGRFFAGAIYGFSPFIFFLARFHPTAGSFAAMVPWLFLPAVFGPKGKLHWTRWPLAILPFVVVAGLFRLAAEFGLYPVPTQIVVQPEDLLSLLAPVAMARQANVLVGFYQVPVAGLVIGTAMLIAARRYSVMAVFVIGAAMTVFDSFSGAARIIWLAVPLLCCSVLIGQGTEGIIHCGYSDRRWMLASAIVLLCCAAAALIFGTEATHIFAGLGAGYTRDFIQAAQMYVAGAIATGVIFFLARGKSRLVWLRAAIICCALAVDIFLGARSLADFIN
jgi:hypothetical protein